LFDLIVDTEKEREIAKKSFTINKK